MTNLFGLWLSSQGERFLYPKTRRATSCLAHWSCPFIAARPE